MHTEHEPIDPSVLAEMGYERRDVNIPAIRKWTIGFFILSFFFFLLGFVFYRWLAPVTFRRAASGREPVTRRIPPQPNPLLQDNIAAKLDIMDMRQQEDEALAGYGWANKERTAARIPIDRAMDLIAQRGANSVPAAAALATPPKSGPSPTGQPTQAGPAGGSSSPGDTAPTTPIPSQAPQPQGIGAAPGTAPKSPSAPRTAPVGGSSNGASTAPSGTNSASN